MEAVLLKAHKALLQNCRGKNSGLAKKSVKASGSRPKYQLEKVLLPGIQRLLSQMEREDRQLVLKFAKERMPIKDGQKILQIF